MKPEVSFVLITRDESVDVLNRTVRGLQRSSGRHRCETVIVDDGSTIPVRAIWSGVRVLRHDVSIGVSKSRRHGLAVAAGEVLVSMDAHMSFAPDWLDRMLAHANSGALLCAAWWDYGLTRPLCWGADFIWHPKRDYSAGYCAGFDLRHRTKVPDRGVVEIPMVIGGCYMILRESYEGIGGFSPFLRVWGKSDQDLSIRSWIAGHGVRCVTGARVGHLSRKRFPYKVRWEDVEFNQLAVIRTAFEEKNVATIEQLLEPIPAQVQVWLAQADLRNFRALVQSRRCLSDAEFFQRFVSGTPESLCRVVFR